MNRKKNMYKKIIENTSDYHTDFIESLKKNPKELYAYIQISVEEYQETGDTRSLLIALRNVTEAKGGIAKLASHTNLNRQALYKTLSLNGNPRLDTFTLVLKELGFQLSIQPILKSA